jgi:hypothetical protein
VSVSSGAHAPPLREQLDMRHQIPATLDEPFDKNVFTEVQIKADSETSKIDFYYFYLSFGYPQSWVRSVVA